MRIEVAGAGAGKTSNMASRLLAEELPDGKIIYCVAFTNTAVRHIEAKLVEMNGSAPLGIRISTIHSFLNTEIIQPYYHLLFGKRYDGISAIELSGDYKAQNAKISELDRSGLLHQTKIPERAKWVVDKKSNDKARIKTMRRKIISAFQSYCHMLVVDEAQDIDREVASVLRALDREGVTIELYGDPKQDIRGRGCFRQLISEFPNDVTYRSDCYRCPKKHLLLSNRLASAEERQVADENTPEGSVNLYFESDFTDGLDTFIATGAYGLVYISKKNERFDTHGGATENRWFGNLCYELESGIRLKYGNYASELVIKRNAYYVASSASSLLNEGNSVNEIANLCVKRGAIDYGNKRYARIVEALEHMAPSHVSGIAVKSIEAIKGLEHNKCLFVLTTDLAPYLMGDKTEDNKTKHLLYVALTRSRKDLSILVTKEVENRYPRNRIAFSLGMALAVNQTI